MFDDDPNKKVVDLTLEKFQYNTSLDFLDGFIQGASNYYVEHFPDESSNHGGIH